MTAHTYLMISCLILFFGAVGFYLPYGEDWKEDSELFMAHVAILFLVALAWGPILVGVVIFGGFAAAVWCTAWVLREAWNRVKPWITARLK
jgi:hypothetical protein